MILKFTGTFQDLKSKLYNLSGEWDESQSNKKVLRVNHGVMNWFETTGSISFQGKDPGKSQLERQVPGLLYPKEITGPSAPQSLPIQNTQEERNLLATSSDETLEKKYLKSGINGSELVIGIVRAVGTESRRVIEPLTDRLRGFGYTAEVIKVSSILPKAIGQSRNEYERIKHYMKAGDFLRERSGDNAILAAGVVKEISEKRESPRGEKRAYIVDSLKHPREVEFLRKIYADGFYMIGIHADEKRRHNFLTDDKDCTQEQAEELIKIDENESFDHGQKTRDTYHLADFFLNLGSNDDQVKNRLQRYLELIFSHPYKNPTFDEFAMFMAFNSSVRSGDLSRQVGAVISREKQIIATGANDVPRSGGGLYWAEIDPKTGAVEDHPAGKDYTREKDSNKEAQIDIIQDIIESIVEENLVSKEKKMDLQKILKSSKISDLTEFGRMVHAEMDALLACGREGISTTGATLYCTTFPCHNCAKHIIASGVVRVVYVEPYPKSRAFEFHSESIKLNSDASENVDGSNKLVEFEPFIGVGPRRFLDLFSMSWGRGVKLRRKDKSGAILDWDKTTAQIRTPLIPKSYLDLEKAAIEIWTEHSST